MVRNYLFICLRSLVKKRLFSFINILGLAIGMAVAIVLWIIVAFELSFDKYHMKADSVFRITSSIYSAGDQWSVVGYDLGPSLKNEIPEVIRFVRRHPLYGGTVVTYLSADDKAARFNETNLQFVDSTFFSLFDYSPIYGYLKDALAKPYSVVITKSISERYFGNAIDPVGKTLNVSNYGDFQVTAVIEDAPQNSHIAVDFLLSMENLLNSPDYKGTNARLENFITYVELDAGINPAVVEAKMPSFLNQYLPNDSYTAHRISNSTTNPPVLKLQPIADIHMADNSAGVGQNEGGSINTVYFLIVISIFILSIAWINYINLSTAKAIERAKEVGIKKALGILKSQLVGQFIFESVVINFISIILSVCLAIPLISFLNGIMDRTFYFDFSKFQLWIWLTVLFVIGSIISGFYPALILSSFRVVDVIKGNPVTGQGGFKLRKVLVVFQFAASLVLIVGTFTVYQQIRFMQNRNDLNTVDQILIVTGPKAADSTNLKARLISFKNSLLQISTIEKVATSDAVPGGGYNWGIHAAKKGAPKDVGIEGQNMEVVFVDPDFLETYRMKMTAGKTWDYSSATEMKSVIINDATLKPFGFVSAENAVQESMIFNDEFSAQILGVVENIHWYSLKNKFTPMVLWPQEVCSGWYSIAISNNISSTISEVEKQFKKSFPDNPFEYYFHDDFFNRQYKAEQQFGKIFSLFALLAIFIACLGLWGLASFTSAQRVKEIGIRKVLGASSNTIVGLLSRDFFKLLVIASIVALPFIWFVMNSWLDNFAFRIQPSFDLYLFPTLLLFILGMGTVSFQTFRAARINPAQSLKEQ